MVDTDSIQDLFISFKAAFDVTKGLVELNRDDKIQHAVAELNSALMDAQGKAIAAYTAQAAFAEKVEKLEAELSRLKEWSGEKERYELQSRSPISPGAIAYRIREELRGNEPVHWLCPTCFQDNVKSILQESGGATRTKTANCPRCNTTLEFRE
ncbi:hypothetical protein [Nisaea nitritireducens]|uniref:hypothetical protein n=1 Tax=Nisaea nitritireducens TaxID=568392 RepID=UPI001867CDAC|nr:hypothetical protein [Nisaea nitritireducens]